MLIFRAGLELLALFEQPQLKDLEQQGYPGGDGTVGVEGMQVLHLRSGPRRAPQSLEDLTPDLHSSSPPGAAARAGIDSSLDFSPVVASKEQQTGVSCSFLLLKPKTSVPTPEDKWV